MRFKTHQIQLTINPLNQVSILLLSYFQKSVLYWAINYMKKRHEHTQPYCLNCYYPLQRAAHFCSNCGQRRTDGKVTFGQLISEFFSAAFNLDNKIFRTLRDLFVPGKLTKAYFKGQHKRYVHPVRFFLVTLIFAIAMVGLEMTEDKFTGMRKPVDRITKEIDKKAFLIQLDTLSPKVIAQNAHPQAIAALDSLKALMHQNDSKSDTIDVMNSKGGFQLFPYKKAILMAKSDIIAYYAEDLVDMYRIEGYWDRIYIQQQIRVYKNPEKLLPNALRSSTWSLLLMMPILALVLALFYIRRHYYYVEHLVFSFHIHSFVFLALGLLFLPIWSSDLRTYILAGFGICQPIYIYLSMKNMYQQGWIKTFLKFSLISFIYLFLFSLIMVLTISLAFFLM